MKSDGIGRVLIFSGGKINLSFAKEYLKKEQFDTIVCADAGLNAANALEVSVDYVMGDFDSVQEDIFLKYKNKEMETSKNVQFIQYPTEKDAADTHMVLRWALSNHPTEIVVLGATGGRIDHLLANINILMESLSKDIPTYIIDEFNKVYLIKDSKILKKEECFGKYISFLPLTEKVSGVTLSGFRYEVSNRKFVIGDSLGVSNELAPDALEGKITMQSGIMIVVESKD